LKIREWSATGSEFLSQPISAESGTHNVRVSYCVTCHGRLWQLALTIFDNLDRLRDDEEIVLLDYGSPDGLARFVESSERCREAIRRGQLVYAYTEAGKHHCSKAKNLAHRLGRGDLLVNLDADNSNAGMRRVIDECFASGLDDVVLHMDDGTAGAFGRICIPRYWFYTLGGYDEAFFPSGYQDRDLLKRAAASGLRYIWSPTAAPTPIANTMREKVSHTGEDNWHTIRNANREMSERNLQEGRLIANAQGWGAAPVWINFGEPQDLPVALPNLISVVLLGSRSLSRVNQILELYNQMLLVGEILVVNNNASRPVEKIERTDSKVTVFNGSGALGLFSRFAVAAQASFPAVLLTDDKIFLPEETLAELHKGWWTDPSILHGVLNDSARAKGWRRKTTEPCEIMPTRAVLTTVLDCFRSLCYAPRFNSEFSGKRSRNRGDLLLSYVVANAARRPNMAYRLPVKELSSKRRSPVSGPTDGRRVFLQ
jgi:hypothetical protein